MTTSRRRAQWRAGVSRSRTAALALMVGLALAASACGASPASTGRQGGSPGTAPVASPSATRSQEQSDLAFARCVRAHGVANFPDPSSQGGFDKTALNRISQTNPSYQGATRACQHLLVAPTVVQQQEVAAEALQFARCMRSHGVANFPDPGGDGRIPDPATVGLDQGAPRFEAANQACGRFRPPYFPSNAAYNAYAAAHG